MMANLRRLVPAIVACILSILQVAAGDPPSYEAWQAACAKLPSNRSLEGRLPPRALLPLQDFREMVRVLDQFFALSTNGPLSKATSWVGRSPEAGTFFNVSRGWFMPPEIPFEPFVQKLVLPAGSKVFLQGDLHGDIQSLLAVLKRLNERKLLNGFVVSDPQLHVIFLGDYTDRGLYGVEVIYTLMRLKLANPDRVHFIRGNHEDLSLIARYGFLAEGRGKYGRDFDAVRILRAYDFLPVAVFLGVGSNFVQLCHGGMEPGYAPAALLAAEGTSRFQFLGTLKQSEFIKQHPGWLGGDPESAREAAKNLKDFVPTAPTTPSVLGFMWNDFTVFSDERVFAHNPDRAFVHGSAGVRYLLGKAGGEGARVRAVFRAHQHSSISNPIMRRIVASRGLFRHWQETNSPSAQNAPSETLAPRLENAGIRSIPDGSVWTLNVTPDSVYGAGCNFDFATYGLLQLEGRFEDWRVAVDTVDVVGR